MAKPVSRVLPWRPATSDALPTSPGHPIDRFPDLMAFYRSQLPKLRPRNHAHIQKTDPARAAQIDGLIVACLMLDGLLSARRDAVHGMPMRLPMAELTEYKVTDEHFHREIVDFAWRRLCERYIKRTRDLLQASAVLGKPWLGGMRFRLAIARMEQVLRAIQIDPAVAYRGESAPRWTDRLMAGLRIAWRALTGRR